MDVMRHPVLEGPTESGSLPGRLYLCMLRATAVAQTRTLSQTDPPSLKKKKSLSQCSPCFIAKVLQAAKGVPIAASMASGWDCISEGTSWAFLVDRLPRCP